MTGKRPRPPPGHNIVGEIGCTELARPKGFEPLTPRFVVWCSIQLSYGRLGLAGRNARRTAALL